MLPCRCRTVLPCDCAEELKRKTAPRYGKGEGGIESGGKSGIETGDKSGDGTSGAKSGDGTSGGSGAIVSGSGSASGGIGDGGSIVGSAGAGAGAVEKGGFLQRLRFMIDRIYNYLGPIGLWNAALALLLLGYYGKAHFWSSRGHGRGLTGGQVGGMGGKYPHKKKVEPPPPCCTSCKCFDQPRILKHRLKWPEDPKPCH